MRERLNATEFEHELKALYTKYGVHKVSDNVLKIAIAVLPTVYAVNKKSRNLLIYEARLSGLTFKVIAEQHGITTSRARQIVAVIERKMRHPSRRGESYLTLFN